jgi:hypothetical protein
VKAGDEVQSGQNRRTHAALEAGETAFSENFDAEGDFDADREDERAMLALAMAGKSLREAIEHLVPISMEPGLTDREPRDASA